MITQTQNFHPVVETRATVTLDLDLSTGELLLELPCPACTDKKRDCPSCHGLGVVPNANGARLLAFLRRHFHEPRTETKKGPTKETING